MKYKDFEIDGLDIIIAMFGVTLIVFVIICMYVVVHISHQTRQPQIIRYERIDCKK